MKTYVHYLMIASIINMYLFISMASMLQASVAILPLASQYLWLSTVKDTAVHL
jgi:hypothetical protein